MRWENPHLFWALWLLPLVGLLLVYAQRQRQRAARRFADARMLPRLMPATSASRIGTKSALLLLGLGLLVTAAARPRFGEYYEEVANRGVDLFVLLDVSKSMLAEDVAPNRLERAKSDVRDLLTRLAGDRVGLITFAGSPRMQVPLTLDHDYFVDILREVDTSSAPRGGSLIGDAIRKGMESLRTRPDRDQVFVLITDGEDQGSYPKEAAQAASEQGIKIFTVGLGDNSDGSRIPIEEQGNRRYAKEKDGQERWSKLNESLLEEIALTTDGAYIPARTTAYDLGDVYDDHLVGLARGEIDSATRKRYREQFQVFAALGWLCLVVAGFVSKYQRNMNASGLSVPSGSAASLDEKNRALSKQRAGSPRRRAGVLRIGSTPMKPRRRGAARWDRRLVVGLAVLLTTTGANRPPREAVEKVRRGVEQFAGDQFEAAGDAFAAAAELHPDDARIAFDQGCALAAREEFDEAQDHFLTAAMSRDAELSSSANYNLGCLHADRAKLEFGADPIQATSDQRRKGLDQLTQAVSHYRNCLRTQPEHADARHNLETIRLWMKQMQALWEQLDKQKQRDELDVFKFLAMIETRQRQLQSTTRQLETQDASPARDQLSEETVVEQSDLANEIEPLKEKIVAHLQPDAQAGSGSAGSGGTAGAQAMGGQANPATAQLAQAEQVLRTLADEALRSMQAAAAELDAKQFGTAVTSQRTTLDMLNDIYMTLVPYPQLLQRSVEVQKSLVQSNPYHGDEDTTPQSPGEAGGSGESARFIEPDQVLDQSRVSRWSDVLLKKAEMGLAQLPPAEPIGPQLHGDPRDDAETDPEPIRPQLPGNPPEDTEMDEEENEGRGETEDESVAVDKATVSEPDPQQQMQEQLAALRASMEKAVDLAPDVIELAETAVSDLSGGRPKSALPSQEDALKLLEEIAEPLQDQQDQNESQQNQDGQDQQQDQDQPQQQDQQQQQDDESKDNQEQPRPRPDQQNQDEQQQPDPRQQQSREQAQSALRRARQRQQEHREKMKEIERILAVPVNVDEDW